jgi:hypothetical protein
VHLPVQDGADLDGGEVGHFGERHDLRAEGEEAGCRGPEPSSRRCGFAASRMDLLP